MYVNDFSPTSDIMSNDQDRKVLVSALKEYAEKLTGLCAEYDQVRDRNRLLLVVVLASMFVFTIAILAFLPQRPLNPLVYYFSTALFISAAFAAAMVILNQESRFKRLRRIQVSTLAVQLERLIRLASQEREHSSQGLAEIIVWDLCLAEAEAALRWSELITGRDLTTGTQYKYPQPNP
jgi:hypothetical protein